MVSSIMAKDVSVSAEVKIPEVEKLRVLTAVQDLPQNGKELPQKDTKHTEQSKDSIDQAVQSMNDYVQLVNRQLEFSIDEKSGRTVITVRDKDTQEIIRQIPDDEALRFARKLQQDGELELFDKFV